MEELLAHAKKNGYSGPMKRDDFKIAKPYPLEYLLIIMHSYIDLFGEKSFDRMAREAAKMRGIIGFLVKWAGSPDLLLSKAQEYWPKFYDFGRLEGEVLDKNKGLVRGYDVSPEPMFCRSLGNYFIGIFENLRYESINVNHVRCVHRGYEFCEWEMVWSK